MTTVDAADAPSGDGIASTPKTDATERRLVDRLGRGPTNALTAVGFGLPVAAYFWLLLHYSVNTVFVDQWSNVPTIKASLAQALPWSALWAQHNETRMLFPNLLVVILAKTTQFDTRTEALLSGFVLLASTVLIILAHRRRAKEVPWLYYCPVVVLAFTFVQSASTLWGFQIAWYLVLFSWAATLYLLDRIELTWLPFVGALGAAVLGSYSLIQGFIVWPIGLLLLYQRKRVWSYLVTWTAAGFVTVLVYLPGYQQQPGELSEAIRNPLDATRFYLFALGDILGFHPTARQVGSAGRGLTPTTGLVILMGAVLLVLALLSVITYGLRRDEVSASPVGVALTFGGLLFLLMVTQGRIFFGFFSASESWFTTLSIMVPTGVYLTLLGRTPFDRGVSPPPGEPVRVGVGTTETTVDEPTDAVVAIEARARSALAVPDDSARTSSGRHSGLVSGLPAWGDRVILRASRVVVFVVIAVQVAVGMPNGLTVARGEHTDLLRTIPVIEHIDQASNRVVSRRLGDDFYSAAYLRQQVAFLEEHHLSLFAGQPREG